VLADFIRSGGYAKHLRRIQRVYRSRLNVLIGSLEKHFGNTRVTGHKGGMHVMWHLNPALPKASEIEAQAKSHGVGIYALRNGAAIDYGQTPYGERSLIIGYASLPETQIRRGILRVAEAVRDIERSVRSR
jgi:GntR family transcriptional regulator/MocR family aminotransferase